MTGNVFKQVGNKWIPSTESDTKDCISSVKSSGTYREYLGIIVEVNLTDQCVTFMTHGDALFRVDDSDLYELGDVVLFDGRVLDENYIPSSKILRSIVGTVSGIISKTMLAVFKT